MERRRTAILISGRGSNMSALAAAAMEPDYPAEISLVVSNRPDAAGLVRAREMGIAIDVVDHKAFGDKAAFEAALTATLERHRDRLPGGLHAAPFRGFRPPLA